MAISDFFSGGQTPDYLSGLLDDEQLRRLKQQAQQNALMQFGLSALSQGGYSQTPVGIGEILGKAGLAGMEGYQKGVQGGIENIVTSQKFAELKKARDRETQMRALAGSLYKTQPAQYSETTQPGINVPVPPVPGQQYPNYATQYQPPSVTRDEISPERQFVDTSVLGKMAALSENPLEALKTQAELVPKLRAAGMVKDAAEQDNPFNLWATGAQSPSVKKLASQYSASFNKGMITDPDKINKTLETLGKMDETFTGRVESAADRKAAQEINAANQAQNNANMQSLKQQTLDLAQMNRQDRLAEKELEKTQKESARQVRLERAQEKANLVTKRIDTALSRTGTYTTGLPGSVIGKLPIGEAYDLREDVKSIKANIGFDELQAMRDASPTGGALGQVAIQELDMLQATLGSLDPNQSLATIRKNLKDVQEHYAKWKTAVKSAPRETDVIVPLDNKPRSKADILKQYGVK